MWSFVSLCLFCSIWVSSFFLFFFFNDTATTEIYTLSLHDALPIYRGMRQVFKAVTIGIWLHAYGCNLPLVSSMYISVRSEEHTSELQSLTNLVCRLLLEKKKKKQNKNTHRQFKQVRNKRKQAQTNT